MLKHRLLTVILMLAIVLPTLLSNAVWHFCLLALFFIAAGAWEWARLNGTNERGALYFAGFFILGATAIWYFGFLSTEITNLSNVWLLASACWVLSSVGLFRAGVSGWGKIPAGLRRASGMLALWLAWLALCQARRLGINFLLSVLSLVWAADTFAYFAGKAWGGKLSRVKLAPSISPGKSWEGVWGGLVGVFLLAAIWIWADIHWKNSVASLYTLLFQQHVLLLVIALLFLTTMSVVGDLIESLIKRSAGVKDSSGLLPGHGGVLDRIDALLPTLPTAMMLVALLT
jgi:phosphatidate cytidylyltransferase